MTIQLDHIIVPAKDRVASARLLAELLGVPWSETSIGPFAAVFVSDSLTLDFDTRDGPVPLTHYCFRVSDAEFDAILGRIRAAGIAFRSSVFGPVDNAVDTSHGGKIGYWSEPDGHAWEMLTVSYARRT